VALLGLDPGEKPVQVFDLARVALNSGDVAADERRGLVEFLLAAPEDKDVRTLADKSLGRREPDAACSAGDDRDFIFLSRHGLCSLNRRPGFQRRVRDDWRPGFGQVALGNIVYHREE
jgi:hypothetical protein